MLRIHQMSNKNKLSALVNNFRYILQLPVWFRLCLLVLRRRETKYEAIKVYMKRDKKKKTILILVLICLRLVKVKI